LEEGFAIWDFFAKKMFKNVVNKKKKKIEIIVISQMLRSIFNRHVQIIVYRSNVLSSISHTKNETEN
jgi:hypothetical protein